MLEVLTKLSDVLGPQARRQSYAAFGLVLVMAVIEALGVASIMPFIALMSAPSALETNRYLAAAYRFVGVESRDAFIIILGLATLFLLVGSVALRALTLWVQLKFVNLQTHLVASRLVGYYLRQPYEWFLRHRSSDMGANVLNEVTNVFQGAAYPVMVLFANAIVSLLLVSVLVAVDALLAGMVTLILGGVYTIVFLLGRRYLGRIGEVRVRSNRERHQALAETFGGIKEIKVAGVEENFLDRFRAPSERMARAGIASALISEMPSFVMQMVVFGGMLLIVIYLKVAHGSLQEALPVISLYALAGYRLMPTLQNTYRNLTAIRYTIPALDSLHRDITEFEHALAPGRPGPLDSLAAQPIGLQETLRLEGLTFHYAGSEHPVLSELDLYVRAFTTVALVGSTGGGKTTAVDLILGLLRPTAGRILVDGCPIDESNVRAWQRSIGYVPQSIFLTDDSVAANVALGVPVGSIDHAAVERACRTASLHDFVTTELPEGYATHVGERGVRLSGGQRQRVGIARALYHDPQLLIFDEATSALDNVTEQAVMEAVYKLAHRKTIIMIAHRLSTVRACDCIHVLERGRIVASGSYDQLLEASGAFRTLAMHGADAPAAEGGDGAVGVRTSIEHGNSREG